MSKGSSQTAIMPLFGMEQAGKMTKPKEVIRVMLVTNVNDASIGCIEQLIDAWPNLELFTYIQGKGNLSLEDVDSKIDIVIIDEPLDQITTKEMVEIFHEQIYVGLIASIKSGPKPAWVKEKYHFDGKYAIGDASKALEKFIDWMNFLIDETEAIRLH